MRILGLDLGEKRIGVAVSDPLGITAQGVKVVQRGGLKRDLEEIEKVVQEYGVEVIVLGLPLNMNGTLGPKAEEVKEFGRRLEQRFNLKVIYQDERLSSKAVEGMLIEADVRRNKRKRVIDKLAAAYILQGYLDRRRDMVID